MKTFQQLSDLTGRTAIITGGAGHLGRAFARTLAELGCKVMLLDISEAALAAAVAELNALYPDQAQGQAVDLKDSAALAAVPARVVELWGRLDIVVNNAAYVGTTDLKGWCVPLPEQSVETWRDCFEVNLTAPFVLSQAAAPYLAESGHGSLINLGSIYGVLAPDYSLYEGTAMGNAAAYGVSKGGLLQLTRYLASTLAPKVRVNALCPGGIARGQAASFAERYEKRTPLGRMASEEDMIGALAYLASDLSRYVTGQTLMVDGGWSAW